MTTAKKMLSAFTRRYIKEQYEEFKKAMQENNAEKVNETYSAMKKGYKHLKNAKNIPNYELNDKAFVAEIETEMDEFMLNVEKEYQEFLKVNENKA